MEYGHGTRGRPASGGPLQGFFGGVRRCTERATNFYAEQGGESPSGELRRMKERVARLERRSASYESKWWSTREFANSEEAGRRMYLRMQAARGPGGELGRTSKRVSTRTANDPPDTAATYVKAEPATTPGPEAVGTDSSKAKRGGATGDVSTSQAAGPRGRRASATSQASGSQARPSANLPTRRGPRRSSKNVGWSSR